MQHIAQKYLRSGGIHLIGGAHDRNRTDEPLPYQGSALPTELRGQLLLQLPFAYPVLSNNKKFTGAGDEIRTRDIQLGRLKLYQLSYSRLNGYRHNS